MATTSEVKGGLDDIAGVIRTNRQAIVQVKARLQSAINELDAVATTFSDVLTTIDFFAGGDEFQNRCVAEKALLLTELELLKSQINTLIQEF